MASRSETGHIKNAANFKEIISFCKGYGAIYNPAKGNLKIVELQLLYQNSIDKLNEVTIAKTAFDYATNERRNLFENLKPLFTKIINAFAVSGADPLAISDAKAINKKLQGIRAKAPQTSDTQSATGTTVTQISTSQLSYDRQIDHLENLIEVLVQNKMYNPNENELKVTSLQAKLAEFKAKNNQLINSYTKYSNAMLRRDQTMYDPQNGIKQMAKEVKLYVKSLFGATSPQFKQISRLGFTSPR
nr:hypothetical protein [uncultured Flavobacterium sp.]